MKRFILAIAAITIVVMWFVPMAQAVTINGERQVQAATYSTVTSDARLTALEKKYEQLDRQFNGSKKGLKKRMENVEATIADNKKAIELQGKTHNNAIESQGKRLANVESLAKTNQKNVQSMHDYLRDFAEKYNKTVDVVNGLADTLFVRTLIGVILGLLAFAILLFLVFGGAAMITGKKEEKKEEKKTEVKKTSSEADKPE